jgi:PAS domain S-box-containing protein
MPQRSKPAPGKQGTCKPDETAVPGSATVASPQDIEHDREESLQAIANQLVVGIVQADSTGRIIFANDYYCEITGYSREELLARHWQEFTHPDDLPRNREFFQRLVSEGSTYTALEKRYLRKNGETIWVSISASLLHNRRNEERGVIAIVTDISKRVEALEALRESEKKYRQLFENSRDALLINSPPRWEFTSANRAALRMFGAKSEAEFTSLTPWNISPEFQPDGAASAVKAPQMVDIAMREGSHLFEWTHKRLDGTTFPAEVMLTSMELNGQVFVQGMLRDITVRKRLERELLERRKEMESLQKQHVAAQTAAAIAHELNQPLLAISSYCEAALMLLGSANPDLDKIRKAISGSERQAHRAGQSIRELLAFLGIKEFSSEAFDLNNEIRGALEAARAEHELQFHSELRLEEKLPPVRANRTHVRKVLLNLLHNGIEAMQDAGVPLPKITVTVRTAKNDGSAQVTIQDNGPGLREEELQRLFEPFFTTKARGIGMGLAISRSLVEANGGQLWADPQEGPGATFHLTLPFA